MKNLREMRDFSFWSFLKMEWFQNILEKIRKPFRNIRGMKNCTNFIKILNILFRNLQSFIEVLIENHLFHFQHCCFKLRGNFNQNFIHDENILRTTKNPVITVTVKKVLKILEQIYFFTRAKLCRSFFWERINAAIFEWKLWWLEFWGIDLDS